MNCFSRRLRDLREERGMTRAELAAKLNISVRLISYWECGKRECSFDTLLQLAEIFNTSTDYLLGRVDY